jgi:hypothetical protein
MLSNILTNMLTKSLRLSGIMLLFVAAVLAQTSNPTSVPFTPRQHRPRLVLPGTQPPVYDPIRHVTVSYNLIWAGYAVTGSDFTYVQGSWVVHSVDCTATPNSDSSEWVGIDGWSSNTVEQTGTDADCNGSTPFYYVWYEFYPLNTIPITDISIAPGDKFNAWVGYDGNNEYTVSITNITTGQSFTKEVEFSGADGSGEPLRNSAEWIEEMDGNQLSDFSQDLFGPLFTGSEAEANSATDSSVQGVIGDFGDAVQQSFTTRTGRAGSKLTAAPSALASDETSFGVTWKSE